MNSADCSALSCIPWCSPAHDPHSHKYYLFIQSETEIVPETELFYDEDGKQNEWKR